MNSFLQTEMLQMLARCDTFIGLEKVTFDAEMTSDCRLFSCMRGFAFA
jgi:hypothetical protein